MQSNTNSTERCTEAQSYSFIKTVPEFFALLFKYNIYIMEGQDDFLGFIYKLQPLSWVHVKNIYIFIR